MTNRYNTKSEVFPAALTDVVVPSQILALLVDVAAEKGILEHQLLAGTGLRSGDLLQQNTFVNFDQSTAIWKNALQAYPDPGLGLTVGSRETLACWGLLGFAMMSRYDLVSALRMAAKYYQTGTGFLDLDFIFADNHCEIIGFAPKPVGALLPTLVEELFSCVLAVFPTLTGVPLRPLKIEFSYFKPRYSHLYDKIFKCPLKFGGERNAMLLDNSYINLPLVTASAATANLAEHLCRESLMKQSQDRGTASIVRRMLLRSPGRYPNMEMVAETIGISVRSLRRRLGDEGESFQSVFDDVRKQLSIAYLSESNMPCEEIAALVGFTENSNFRRAFKRWTNLSPTDYRKHLADLK